MITTDDAALIARKKRRHRNERIAATVLVLALTAGLLQFLRWNARDDEEFQQQRLYIPGKTEITPEISLLRDYLRIDTRAGKEMDGARFLVRALAERGVRAELIESAPGRGNVYARIKGRQSGGGLLLLHHIDVVDPGTAAWAEGPFAGNVRQNMLIGRGALDMKSIGVTHLLAFVEVARSGRAPEHDLVFLATSDEEQGGALGVQWLIAHRPDVLAGVKYALNEGGLNEMIADKMNYFGIEVGAKQFASLTLEAPTAAQLERARIALEPLAPRPDPDEITPEVARFFRDIAPTRIQFRDLLADIHKTAAEGQFWRLPISYREFTQNAVSVNAMREENGRHVATVVLANIPGYDVRDSIESVARIARPSGARIASIEQQDPAPVFTSPDTPLFRIISSLASSTYGCPSGTLVLYRSTSDSRFLRQQGIFAYGVLPFPVDFFQSQSIHGVNERIRLDYFLSGVRLMSRIVREYVSGSS